MSGSESWQLSEERIRQFDSAADAYDRHRPPFPAEAFDRLVETARLSPGSRVLEVGAGAARATVELVARGLRVTALEPGDALRAIGEARTAGILPAVEWHPARFETWPAPPAAFDLVFAADAWHWIEPSLGARLAAATLRPGGHLAILWSAIEAFVPDSFATGLAGAWAAEGLGRDVSAWLDGIADDGAAWIEPIVATGSFEPAARTWHAFERRLTSRELTDEFGSYGWVIALPPDRRDALLRSTLLLVEHGFGGSIVRRDAAVLYVLRRSDTVIG